MRAAFKENVLTTMLINDPATVAELQQLYPRYEQALITNDVETLMSLFWSSPLVARFGPAESLYGIEEIDAFRKDFASVTLGFRRELDGKVTRGRQSQTWARLPEGWRIVFAHVSLLH
jgi:hypothetical protein